MKSTLPTILDCLEIADGEFFEYEDHDGNFCVEPKELFMGGYADTSRGQSIEFKSGYCWRWHDDGKARRCGHRRSEVFGTRQEAFESAFDNLFVLYPVLERTKDIGDWFEYARNNGLQDTFIVDHVNGEVELV